LSAAEGIGVPAQLVVPLTGSGCCNGILKIQKKKKKKKRFEFARHLTLRDPWQLLTDFSLDFRKPQSSL